LRSLPRGYSHLFTQIPMESRTPISSEELPLRQSFVGINRSRTQFSNN
jgi:hypothetical protein